MVDFGNPDFSLLEDIFRGSTFLGEYHILSLFVTLLTMLIITRNIEKWKLLFLPVLLGWHFAGITAHPTFIVIGVIVFAIEGIGIQTIGNVIGTAVTASRAIFDKSKEIGKTVKGNIKAKQMLDKIEKHSIKEPIFTPKTFSFDKAMDKIIVEKSKKKTKKQTDAEKIYNTKMRLDDVPEIFRKRTTKRSLTIAKPKEIRKNTSIFTFDPLLLPEESKKKKTKKKIFELEDKWSDYRKRKRFKVGDTYKK